MSFIKKISKLLTDKDKDKKKMDENNDDGDGDDEISRIKKHIKMNESKKSIQSKGSIKSKEFKASLKKFPNNDDDDDDDDDNDDEFHNIRTHISDLQSKKDERKRALIEWELQHAKGHPSKSINTDAHDQRRRELMKWEMEYSDSLTNDDESNAKKKRDMLMRICDEERALSMGIENIQIRKDKDKENILDSMNNLEEHSRQLIEKVNTWQEMQRRELGDLLSKDDAAHLEMMRRREGSLHLRRGQVIDAMVNAMERELSHASVTQQLKGVTQNELRERICEEEEYQRKAFMLLQQSRDTHHRLIISEIALIQQELVAITKMEIQKKMASEGRLNEIRAQRKQLAQLLAELYAQRDARERQLLAQMKRIEEFADEESDNFWLVQYQLLLEQQPITIQLQLLNVDPRIGDIIIKLSNDNPTLLIGNYIQYFATLSYEQFATMNEKDLINAGIEDYELCRELCSAIADATMHPSRAQSQPATRESLPEFSGNTKLWCQWECVICLDESSRVVFLPCGHVCACLSCSAKVTVCPMCRVTIAEKCDIYQSME